MAKRGRGAEAHLRLATSSTNDLPAPSEVRPAGVPVAAPAPGLTTGRIEALDPGPPGQHAASRRVKVRIGTRVEEAQVDEAVQDAVLRTAWIRRERVLLERDGDTLVVLGALRTAATPGVDEGDEFHIRARRVAITGAHELSFVSGTASIALRALGTVETLAQDITSRASSIHKIVGRLIRLN